MPDNVYSSLSSITTHDALVIEVQKYNDNQKVKIGLTPLVKSFQQLGIRKDEIEVSLGTHHFKKVGNTSKFALVNTLKVALQNEVKGEELTKQAKVINKDVKSEYLMDCLHIINSYIMLFIFGADSHLVYEPPLPENALSGYHSKVKKFKADQLTNCDGVS